jgi:hypothetical protein
MVAKHQSRMTIDIPEEDHKRLKALAALRGESMRTIILSWIQENLYSANSPNAATLRAIEKVEKGEDLVRSNDLDDLFDKLGL